MQNIQNQINELKTSHCDDCAVIEVLNTLHDQLNRAFAANWTQSELSEYIKIDRDALESGAIAEGTALYADIRNIQDQIISSVIR